VNAPTAPELAAALASLPVQGRAEAVARGLAWVDAACFDQDVWDEYRSKRHWSSVGFALVTFRELWRDGCDARGGVAAGRHPPPADP